MLNRWKFVLIAALAFCLSFPVLAGAAKEPTLELNVAQSIELALEHNLDFGLVTIDWQGAKAKLERANIVGDEEMLKEAEKEWEKAQKDYEEQRKNLTSLVRSSYQELLESEANVVNRERAKERAEQQLTIDENKYKAGLLSTLDVERAKNSLFDAEHSYQKALVDLETQRMTFSQILGLPLQQEIVLTERLLLDFRPFTLDLETCYKLASTYDQGIITASDNLAKAEEAVVLAQSPFTARVELEKAQASLEKARIQVEKAEQALYLKIRGEYFALQDQAHALKGMEKNIELERQILKAEESKYAAGVLSNVQIVAQQEKLAQLEQQYSASLLSYSLSRLRLLQAIGEQGAVE